MTPMKKPVSAMLAAQIRLMTTVRRVLTSSKIMTPRARTVNKRVRRVAS